MEEAVSQADKLTAPLAEKAMEGVAAEGANAVIETAPEVAQQVIQTTPNYALWFLLGCIFVMVFIIVFELIKAKREK